MAYPCWRDWSETSNVLFVNKPIERVVAFCRFEDHLNPATRDVDLEIALSGSVHLRLDAVMGMTAIGAITARSVRSSSSSFFESASNCGGSSPVVHAR